MTIATVACRGYRIEMRGMLPLDLPKVSMNHRTVHHWMCCTKEDRLCDFTGLDQTASADGALQLRANRRVGNVLAEHLSVWTTAPSRTIEFSWHHCTRSALCTGQHGEVRTRAPVNPGQTNVVWTGAAAAARSWHVARISPTIACLAVTYDAVLATAFSDNVEPTNLRMRHGRQ